MRRLELLACVLCAFPLAAGSAGAGQGPPLGIATFQADVTPPLGSPLCHGNVQPAKEIVDPLSARGIVLLTDRPPVVLCAVDWVGISNTGHDAWRQSLAEAVGTSPDRVSVHTLHQHDTPGIDFMVEDLLAAHGLGGRRFDPVSTREAIERTARAAREAVKHP